MRLKGVYFLVYLCSFTGPKIWVFEVRRVFLSGSARYESVFVLSLVLGFGCLGLKGVYLHPGLHDMSRQVFL